MRIVKQVNLIKQTANGSVSMTLPKIFVDMYDLKPGDKATFIFDNKNPNQLTIKF